MNISKWLMENQRKWTSQQPPAQPVEWKSTKNHTDTKTNHKYLVEHFVTQSKNYRIFTSRKRHDINASKAKDNAYFLIISLREIESALSYCLITTNGRILKINKNKQFIYKQNREHSENKVNKIGTKNKLM